MDRDECIITVYCLVCEQYQAIKNTYPVRRGGFAPALSDEEVITMELCGEYFKLTTDKDLFAYFRAHYAHFFPKLTERTLFVRQAQGHSVGQTHQIGWLSWGENKSGRFTV